MARHRDIRNMDYEDEYDGYDDIYGHSIDDDYYISPSNRQFIYNRESSRDARFEHTEDDIQEVDEIEELSDTDKAKLNSCIDKIKSTLGSKSVPQNELINLIMKYKFDVELVLNAILASPKSAVELKEKDVGQCLGKKFLIPQFPSAQFTNPQSNCFKPKLNGFKKFETNNFPNILQSTCKEHSPNIFSFNKGSGNNLLIVNYAKIPESKQFPILKNPRPNAESSSVKINSFLIPKLKSFKMNIDTPSSSSSTNNSKKLDEEFSSLSELVSNHLKHTPKDNVRPHLVTQVTKNLSDVHISKNARETKSPTKDVKINKFNIDLSKALKITSSLPNISKNQLITPEKFEIPFIDCDTTHSGNFKSSKRKRLPCTLDVTNILNLKLENAKKVSKFGKVICSSYRHPPKNIIIGETMFPNNIKKFTFNTMSPDDFIIFNLKKKNY